MSILASAGKQSITARSNRISGNKHPVTSRDYSPNDNFSPQKELQLFKSTEVEYKMLNNRFKKIIYPPSSKRQGLSKSFLQVSVFF